MRRQHVRSFNQALGREMNVIAYGHGGLPVLVFPSSEGKAGDFENFGMVATLSPLIDAGSLTLYCVDSYDSESWYGRHRPLHERAWRHSLFENWIMNDVVPAIGRDVGDPGAQLTTTGCSFGAYHAANFALRHPDRFNHALCMSGVYDIRFLLNGHHDDWVYSNNPVEYVTHLNGALGKQIQQNVFITLVCGQGPWEDHCLDSTKKFWDVLSRRQLPNYMDLWGHDVAHDWPWWRKQIAWYMSHLVEGRHPWRNTSSA